MLVSGRLAKSPMCFFREDVLLALLGRVGFLSYVIGGFDVAAVSARGLEIGLPVFTAIAQGLDVIALPVLAPGDLPSAKVTKPSASIEDT